MDPRRLGPDLRCDRRGSMGLSGPPGRAPLVTPGPVQRDITLLGGCRDPGLSAFWAEGTCTFGARTYCSAWLLRLTYARKGIFSVVANKLTILAEPQRVMTSLMRVLEEAHTAATADES